MRKTTRASGSASATRSDDLNILHDHCVTICRRNIYDTVVCRATALDDLDMSRAEALGFSTKGLLTLPWELVPYSFVVDWFLNVSDVLNALAPVPGWKLLGSCLVTRRVRHVTWTASGTSESDFTYSVQRPVTGTIVGTFTDITRGPLREPSLVLKTDFRLGRPLRALDAYALAGQRLSKQLSRFGVATSLYSTFL